MTLSKSTGRDSKYLPLQLNLSQECLTLLKEGKPCESPLFDIKTKIRLDKKVIIQPTKLIILEGNLIYYDEVVRDLCDLKLFIDMDDDVRLAHRVLDFCEDNQNLGALQDLLYRYEQLNKPCFEKFIEPTKKFADIIIPNAGYNKVNGNLSFEESFEGDPFLHRLYKMKFN